MNTKAILIMLSSIYIMHACDTEKHFLIQAVVLISCETIISTNLKYARSTYKVIDAKFSVVNRVKCNDTNITWKHLLEIIDAHKSVLIF